MIIKFIIESTIVTKYLIIKKIIKDALKKIVYIT